MVSFFGRRTTGVPPPRTELFSCPVELSLGSLRVPAQSLGHPHSGMVPSMDKPSPSTLVLPIALPTHIIVKFVALLPPVTVVGYSLLVHPVNNYSLGVGGPFVV